MNDCFSYFKNVFAKINPNKLFHIPNWIPLLPDPSIEFDLEPPTYQQVTNIIRKMKTSGSPCPLDQLSIICFKRCPYLRSYLTVVEFYKEISLDLELEILALYYLTFASTLLFSTQNLRNTNSLVFCISSSIQSTGSNLLTTPR